MNTPAIENCEAPAAVRKSKRAFTIGLPRCDGGGEKRFPLTPEAVAIMTERGYEVRMEHGAGSSIHYTDAAYLRCGAVITGRTEAFGCDIVIHLRPVDEQSARLMRRGAMLLTMSHYHLLDRRGVKALLDNHIITIAIDRIADSRGNTPFADILSEIDGRASVAIASALLADPVNGKGILLGGVAGIVPCEATIIGSGIAACAAARSASGAGAMVRIFDDDVYRLRDATRDLGAWAIGSSLHPRVVRGALRTADIVVVTDTSIPPVLGGEIVDEMKRGVVIFDLSSCPGRVFPSLKCIDLADAVAEIGEVRCCYVNAGSAVPRTAAMALSNTFLTFFSDITASDGLVNALRLMPGMQRAAMTFLGKAVDSRVASIARVRPVDINIYLTLS